MLTLALVLACSGEEDKDKDLGVDTGGDDTADDTGKVKPPEIVLGDPYVAIVAASTPGSLGSTCELDMVLTNLSDGTEAASLALSANGRDWAGADLDGGVQYKANVSAVGCRSEDKSFESGTFSGQEGILFVLWYAGVNLGYDALEQGTEGADFLGGEATVVVANSVPDGNVQAVAAGVGVEAELTTTDAAGNTYLLSWETEVSVGHVLSEFTAQLGDDYVSGTPTWLEEPSWW